MCDGTAVPACDMYPAFDLNSCGFAPILVIYTDAIAWAAGHKPSWCDAGLPTRGVPQALRTPSRTPRALSV
jgi:hypothetical protein